MMNPQKSAVALMRDAALMAQNAVHFDGQGQHTLALAHYQQCVGLFLEASACNDCDVNMKSLIVNKTGEYLARAEFLKGLYTKKKVEEPKSVHVVVPVIVPIRAGVSEPVAAVIEAPQIQPRHQLLTKSSPSIMQESSGEPLSPASPTAVSSQTAPLVSASSSSSPSIHVETLRSSAPNSAPSDADWERVYRKIVLLDAEETVSLEGLTSWEAKLHGVTQRRGRLFVSRSRFCFAPHVEWSRRTVPADASYFQMSEVVSVPFRQVTAVVREDVFYVGASRIRITTRAGELLFRGLALTRERIHQRLFENWRATMDALKVFGCSLGTLLARDQIKNPDQSIPCLLEKMVGELEERGLQAEGLFQPSSAVSASLGEYVIILNSGDDLEWTELDVYIVAELLKKLLRESADPLIPADLGAMIVASVKQTNVASCSKSVKSIVSLLSDIHRRILKFLTFFWATVAARSDENRMTSKRLGALFASCIFHSDDPEEMQSVALMLNILIQERRTMF